MSIGPEQAKINARFAAMAEEEQERAAMRRTCDRCGVETYLNALCDDCLAMPHRPGCDNVGWGRAAYCGCNQDCILAPNAD